MANGSTRNVIANYFAFVNVIELITDSSKGECIEMEKSIRHPQL